MGAFPRIMKEFCFDFFQHMDNGLCVNLQNHWRGSLDPAWKGKLPPWFNGTWCYVSSDCSRLNNGHKVSDKTQGWLWKSTLTRDVSWKVCELGRDRALRTIPPVELFALAERH